MGFSVETSIPVLTVFLQGLLSFFSPCVLPLLPMYISYLSGGGRTVDQEGNVHYKRRASVSAEHRLFCGGHQLRLFPAGAGLHGGRDSSSGKTGCCWAVIGGVLVILYSACTSWGCSAPPSC